jgi:hypothetical protein
LVQLFPVVGVDVTYVVGVIFVGIRFLAGDREEMSADGSVENKG